MIREERILAGKIADALGIKHCRALDIHMKLGERIIINAEFSPEIEGIKKILPILEEFELMVKTKK